MKGENTMNIKLVPYISFQGNCEEALGFYKAIFNGKVTIHTSDTG